MRLLLLLLFTIFSAYTGTQPMDVCDHVIHTTPITPPEVMLSETLMSLKETHHSFTSTLQHPVIQASFQSTLQYFHNTWLADFAAALRHISNFFSESPEDVQSHQTLIILCHIAEHLQNFNLSEEILTHLLTDKAPSKSELLRTLCKHDPFIPQQLKSAHALQHIKIDIVYTDNPVLHPLITLASTQNTRHTIPFPTSIDLLPQFHTPDSHSGSSHIFCHCVNDILRKSSYVGAINSILPNYDQIVSFAIRSHLYESDDDREEKALAHSIAALRNHFHIDLSSFDTFIKSAILCQTSDLPKHHAHAYNKCAQTPQTFLSDTIPRIMQSFFRKTLRMIPRFEPKEVERSNTLGVCEHWNIAINPGDGFQIHHLKSLILKITQEIFLHTDNPDDQEHILSIVDKRLGTPKTHLENLHFALFFNQTNPYLPYIASDGLFFLPIPEKTTINHMEEHNQIFLLENIVKVWCMAVRGVRMLSLDTYTKKSLLTALYKCC